MKKIANILFVVILIQMTACQDLSVFASMDFGPVTMEVESTGAFKINAKAGFRVPTPFGSFAAGLIYNPSSHFNVSHTLTVRVNGLDHIYDLQGQSFNISFPPGYYKGINIWNEGNNLFVEIKTNSSNVVQNNIVQSLSVQIRSIEFNYTYQGTQGMKVNLYARADGYKNTTLIVGLFFLYTHNNQFVLANSFTPQTNISANQQLASYYTITSTHDYTEWNDMWFFVPNNYLSHIAGGTQLYASAQLGVNGGAFTSFSNPYYLCVGVC